MATAPSQDELLLSYSNKSDSNQAMYSYYKSVQKFPETICHSIYHIPYNNNTNSLEKFREIGKNFNSFNSILFKFKDKNNIKKR